MVAGKTVGSLDLDQDPLVFVGEIVLVVVVAAVVGDQKAADPSYPFLIIN